MGKWPPDAAAAALAALPDAVVVSSPEGLITGWLGAADQVLGYREADVVGRHVSVLFPDEGHRDLDELALLDPGDTLEVSMRMRTRDGHRIDAAVTLAPLPGAGGVVAMIRPLGDWADPGGVPDPEWNRSLGRVLRELVEVAGADLAAVERTETLARVLVEQGRRLVPGIECLLALVPAGRQSNFRIVAAAGPWGELQVGMEWPRAGSLAGRAMDTRRPIETVRLQEESALRRTLEPGGIHTARLIPLLTREPLPDGRSALGLIGFYRRRRQYFTPHQRRLMGEFARLVSLLLQRSELSAEVARGTERLQVGVDVAVDLARSLAPADVVRRLLRRGLAALDADRATLLRADGRDFVLVDAADVALPAARPGVRHPQTAARDLESGEPIAARSLELGRPVAGGPYTVEGAPPEALAALAGIRHTLAVPLVDIGSGPAVLLVSRRRDTPFGPADEATAQLVGNVAALALRNAWLYSEVEEATRVKSDFLNMAAHELRTPLTVIRGYVSMLGEGSFGDIPDGFRPPLLTLSEKTDELGDLVEDLLLAGRLDSGRIEANQRPLDAVDAVAEAVARHSGTAAAAGGRVTLEPSPRVTVVADARHLARVLDVMFDNALGYCAGAPEVTVTVRRDPDRGMVEIAVKDNGIGIEAALTEQVFQRFFRVDDDRSLQRPGTGLGLYIGRELARRQGGDLVLESTAPGNGSRFVLVLPAGAAPRD